MIKFIILFYGFFNVQHWINLINDKVYKCDDKRVKYSLCDVSIERVSKVKGNFPYYHKQKRVDKKLFVKNVERK